MSYRFFCLLILIFGLLACQPKTKKPDSIQFLKGAWHVKSLAWISDEKTHLIEEAQAGLFLFEKTHYSLMWSPKTSPRTPFKHLSKPTEDEILQGFRSIVFNAGTYVVNGDQLVATAQVAKVPGFEGGQLFYLFNHTETTN